MQLDTVVDKKCSHFVCVECIKQGVALAFCFHLRFLKWLTLHSKKAVQSFLSANIMVYSDYTKLRILYFHTNCYHPPAIKKILDSEGVSVS